MSEKLRTPWLDCKRCGAEKTRKLVVDGFAYRICDSCRRELRAWLINAGPINKERA